MVPRRLISPQTVSGAPGSLVIGWGVTISRNDSIAQAKALPPTSNTSSRRVGTCGPSSATGSGGSVTVSLIETVRGQRVNTGRQRVLARDDGERMSQIL